jgi:hypothetical protein
MVGLPGYAMQTARIPEVAEVDAVRCDDSGKCGLFSHPSSLAGIVKQG